MAYLSPVSSVFQTSFSAKLLHVVRNSNRVFSATCSSASLAFQSSFAELIFHLFQKFHSQLINNLNSICDPCGTRASTKLNSCVPLVSITKLIKFYRTWLHIFIYRSWCCKSAKAGYPLRYMSLKEIFSASYRLEEKRHTTKWDRMKASFDIICVHFASLS